MLSDRRIRLGWLLMLFLACSVAGAATQMDETPVYAIQLESSRKPHLADYALISEYGTLYTYRPRGTQGLVRVRMGYYHSRAEAEAALEKIRAQGFSDAYLSRVRDPGRDRAVLMPSPAPVKAAARPPQTTAETSPQKKELQATVSTQLPPAGKASVPVPKAAVKTALPREPVSAKKPHPMAKQKSRRPPSRRLPAAIAGEPIPDPFAE